MQIIQGNESSLYESFSISHIETFSVYLFESFICDFDPSHPYTSINPFFLASFKKRPLPHPISRILLIFFSRLEPVI